MERFLSRSFAICKDERKLVEVWGGGSVGMAWWRLIFLCTLFFSFLALSGVWVLRDLFLSLVLVSSALVCSGVVSVNFIFAAGSLSSLI